MGNEASSQLNPDDLEEQARAPPSVEDFESREAARAAATGGNVYQQPAGLAKMPAQPQVGMLYEKSKKGLGRAGARGAALVNSMRHLAIGVRKKEATEWEKNWDEDESDDEEEDAVAAAPLHARQMEHGFSVPPPPAYPEPTDLLSEPLPGQEQLVDPKEWDTADDTSQKPNARMFPMLRVLGKGSFGKVCVSSRISVNRR